MTGRSVSFERSGIPVSGEVRAGEYCPGSGWAVLERGELPALGEARFGGWRYELVQAAWAANFFFGSLFFRGKYKRKRFTQDIDAIAFIVAYLWRLILPLLLKC